MNDIMTFIETHPETNKIMLFILGLIVAWISGIFKLIRLYIEKLDIRLRLEIEPSSARILYLKESEDGKGFSKRFAIWLNLSIANPSEKLLSIKRFELKFRNKDNKWSESLFPTTFPSSPRTKVGDSVKIFPVFFTRFLDTEALTGDRTFSADGRIAAYNFQTGYLLFVEEYYGTWLPENIQEKINIKVICFDIKGKKYELTGMARNISFQAGIEAVPGIEKYRDDFKYLGSVSRIEGITSSKKENKE
ncbi:hypothetical protein [Leptospira sanjuanensis]|uniref:hypothetical protein n=1 Tax=Leptospira sanjuanensis TaxID=2879643 RepID=UPI001EE819D1|nr:hypothetical protein [Leptospira sanjuanensis]MCG6170136.1 hypothetical protein [Leptospira sanjuanensis]